MATIERSLMVQCNRPDLGTAYAFFNLAENELVIFYVNIEGGKTTPVLTEHIPFSTYPEAAYLHDGKAWNTSEVNCWVRFAERVEERTNQ